MFMRFFEIGEKFSSKNNELKIECPVSGLLVEDDKTIAEIFKTTFVDKTSELENKSNTNLGLILEKLETACARQCACFLTLS